MPEPDLEIMWSLLLSRSPELVRAAYASLEPDEQHVVLAHLKSMVEGPGWQAEQRISAQVALDALQNLPPV